MTPLYRFAVLRGLVAVYVLCCGELRVAPRPYAKLFLMHLFGAVIALYLGEETGKVPPIISTRSVWIVVGVLFMGAGPMWMLGIK